MSEHTKERQEQEGMSFVGHLKELRQRLMYSMIVVLVIFLVLFYFANDIYSYLSGPLREFLPENSQMIATEVTSPFFAPFKLALFLSFVIAMPYLLFQVWGFIAPGLYEKEKRFVIPVFLLSILLFYFGMVFAYYVVFPVLFGFFTSAGPDEVIPMTDINQYLSFTIKILMAFGLAFEVPIATLFLVKSGVSTVESLSKKRSYIILGCFVIGMLMTPPDIISQTLLAIPMWILFELGLLLSRYVAKPSESEVDEDEDDSSDGINGEADTNGTTDNSQQDQSEETVASQKPRKTQSKKKKTVPHSKNRMDSSLPAYSALQKRCDQLEEPINISGLHGSISAMLAVNSNTTIVTSVRQYGDGELSGDFLENHPDMASDFEDIYTAIHHQLNETDFDYHVYLPDDDQGVGKRLKALTHWCNDFLLAFAIAQSGIGSTACSQEIRKLLNQFSQFSQVDCDLEENEEAESDYQEIIEFVRMGVVYIHSDFHTSPRATQ